MRQTITETTHAIDRELQANPDSQGESRQEEERVFFVYPLGIQIEIDAERFLDFAKLGFSQKRKTLANNLRSKVRRDKVLHALAFLNLRPDARAEQLTVRELAALAQELSLVSTSGKDEHERKN